MANRINLRYLAEVIRSKNAGPVELTLDIIFKDSLIYNKVKDNNLITREAVAALYKISPEDIISFVTFDPALAIKITIVRPIVCGNVGDTDVYGAQQHAPLLDMELPWE